MKPVKLFGFIKSEFLRDWITNALEAFEIQFVEHLENLFDRVITHPLILLVIEASYLDEYYDYFELLLKKKNNDRLFFTVIVGDALPQIPPDRCIQLKIHDIFIPDMPREHMQNRIYWMVKHLEQQYYHGVAQIRCRSYTGTINALNEIGIALSSTEDIDQLLNQILYHIRRVTHSDAGSIYLVKDFKYISPLERNQAKQQGELPDKYLIFKIAHNDTMRFPFEEVELPVQKTNLAGYVAFTGEPINLKDAYNIPMTFKFQFNKNIDESSGYRSKSFLVVPMKNHKDEIVGVLQLINRKRHWDKKLTSPDLVAQEVVAYDETTLQMAQSVASQAAVAIDNFQMIHNIQRLFDRFSSASIYAIEQRDPTMVGHSERVARLAVKMAKEINLTRRGKYKDAFFTEDQIQELYHAALLHDFGKIAVPERVLLKAKRLYSSDWEYLRTRYALLKMCIEQDLVSLPPGFSKKSDVLNEIKQTFAMIQEHIAPISLSQEYKEKIIALAQMELRNENDEVEKFIPNSILQNLLISQGTLNSEERKLIEAHAEKTWEYLSNIPWPHHLKQVPEIARYHHEQLDGTGYPKGITEDEIPIGSKILGIVDKYDAMVASDRPYKDALPIPQVLAFLKGMAAENKLDSELVNLFIQRKIYGSV